MQTFHAISIPSMLVGIKNKKRSYMHVENEEHYAMKELGLHCGYATGIASS